MNEHDWFIERIAAALAGGLPSDEQSRFDAHRAGCADCAREFDALEQTEQSMTQLFADIVPPSDFEQRLLSRLRLSAPRRIPPMVRRAAVAASVALLLGGFGYVANRQIESGGLDVNHFKFATNLRETGHADLMYRNENRTPSRREPSDGDQNPSAEPNTTGFELKLAETSDAATKQLGAGEASPFTGVARDMISTRDRFHQIADHSGAASGDGGVLLPADEARDGAKDRVVAATTPGNASATYYLGRRVTVLDSKPQSAAAPATPALTPAQTAGESGLSGANSYGGTVVVGGTLQLGSPAHPITFGASRGGGDVTKDFVNGASTNELFYRPNQLASDDVSKSATEREPVRQALEAGKPIELANQTQPGDQLAAATDEEKTRTGEVTGKSFVDASAPAAAPADTQSAPTTQAILRKVIRNGTVEFEIDSFDSAAMTVTKIVAEEGGYIATTNSDKLPNGKVKGTIVVRIPPDHLDTLVMKLRALGDLKSQNLTAEDVTKQYTDTASELRAAQAMQERLLDIIKKSQGQIKDLLAAEKELATWREKIEKLQGEIRYYDNLVSLSTLNISLFERDIKQADVLKETENVDMGVETDDVEQSRASAIKAIDDAKGRIVESELKKLDAGQLAGKVVADIPPDAAGPAIDRLKQLGKVARLEIHREQKSANNQPASPGTKLQRGDTHLVLSLYNLANVAPRQTTNATLAATNVEEAYNAILKLAADVNGRVVTSNLNRQTDQQTAGVVQLEVKSDDADATLQKLRANGELTRLTVTENPDTANVTSAKRGFDVQIVSLASLLPREVNNRALASADVDQSYQSLLQTLRKNKARIIVSRIEDEDKGQHNAYIDFEIPRAGLDDAEKAIAAAGETYNRSVNAAQDAENVTDSKVQFKLAISPAASLPVRQTDALAVETSDVDAAAQTFQSATASAGGRVIDANFSKDQHGQTARLIVEVPFSAANQLIDQAKHTGTVRGSQQSTNQQAPSGEFARARVELTLATPDVLVTPEHGVMATLRSGISTSFAGLMWSLELIVIGLCLVAPWVLLIWFGAKLIRRARSKSVTA